MVGLEGMGLGQDSEVPSPLLDVQADVERQRESRWNKEGSLTGATQLRGCKSPEPRPLCPHG